MFKKIGYSFACVVCCSTMLYSQIKSIKVDCYSKATHAISPYIYGTNESINNYGVKAVRQGGNRWSGYNWENNLSNAGTDYGNISDGFLGSAIPGDSALMPGSVAMYFFDQARMYNQFLLTTVPMAGKVAKTSGTVSSTSSLFWDEVKPTKNAPFSLQPDVNDGVVYVDEYIYYLVSKFKTAKYGGIQAYGLDNEPDLWKVTHPYIHPANTKINELISKTVATSLAVKSVDSTALVFGPSMSGWYGCKNFFGLDDNAWYPVSGGISTPYYNDWFLSLYLDSMRYYSDKYKKRLIDVVNVHWYPEARSMENVRIVNVKGGTEPLTKSAIKARLQAPRSLWDTTYLEIGPLSSSPLCLLKRIKKSVDKFNPNTKIGITEYRYGTEDHYSGGLALADALGVFGRENVFYASKWAAKGGVMFYKYSQSAFDLYTNYDGKYSMFGEISVPTLNSSNDTLSSFGAYDQQKRLHMIVINKIPATKQLTIDFSGKYFLNAEVYGFDSLSHIIQKRDSVKSAVPFSECTYELPAYSACHFIFSPLPEPTPVLAQTDSTNAKLLKIVLSLPLQDTKLSNTDFTVYNNGVAVSTDSAIVVDTSVAIYLSSTVSLTDTSLYVKFLKSLTNDIGFQVAITDSIKINNVLKGSLPQLVNAEVLKTANEIRLEFSKSITQLPIQKCTITYNGLPVAITANTIKANSVTFTVDTRATKNDIVRFSFSDNVSGIVFFDQSSIKEIAERILKSNITDDNLMIDTAILYNAGFNIAIKCNKRIAPQSTLQNLKVLVNGISKTYSATIINTAIYITFSSKIEYGDVIQISYTDQGEITSTDGGYLLSVDKNVKNTLAQPPSRVTIPAKIEGEDYYYILGNAHKAISGSVSAIKIYTDGEASYRITVPSDGVYTIIFNKSSLENMEFSVKIGAFDTIVTFPKTNSYTIYRPYGMVVGLKKGDYTVTVKPILPLTRNLEIDYIEFKSGVNIPNTQFLSGMVSSSGTLMTIYFDNYLKSAVTLADLQLKVNGNVKNIKSLTQKENVLLLYNEDTIYKKQIVEIEFDNAQLLADNGGLVSVFTKQLTNSSSVLYVKDDINNSYFANIKNGSIVTNIPQTATIQLFNSLGVEMCLLKNGAEYSLCKNICSGSYFIVAKENNKIIYKNQIVVVE